MADCGLSDGHQHGTQDVTSTVLGTSTSSNTTGTGIVILDAYGYPLSSTPQAAYFSPAITDDTHYASADNFETYDNDNSIVDGASNPISIPEESSIGIQRSRRKREEESEPLLGAGHVVKYGSRQEESTDHGPPTLPPPPRNIPNGKDQVYTVPGPLNMGPSQNSQLVPAQPKPPPHQGPPQPELAQQGTDPPPPGINPQPQAGPPQPNPSLLDPAQPQPEPPQHGAHHPEPHQLDSPLLRPPQHERVQHRFNKKKCCCCVCVIFVIILILILAAIGAVVIWETSAVSKPVVKSTVLVQGDYVGIPITTEKHFSPFYNLSFAVTKMIKDVVVIIYRLPCNQLHKYERNKTIPVINSSGFFSNCSVFSPRCPLNEYVYLMKDNDTVVKYNVIVHSFVPDKTEIRFVVFNDEKKYKDYLNDTIGVSEAVKVETMAKNATPFSFTSADMSKQQSYYFFSLDKVQNELNQHNLQYEVSHSEVLVSYEDLYELNPHCTLLNTNNYSCEKPIPFLFYEDQCYVAHLQGTVKHSGMPNKDEIIELSTTLDRTSTGDIVFISSCALVSFLIVIVIFIALYYFIHCSHK